MFLQDGEERKAFGKERKGSEYPRRDPEEQKSWTGAPAGDLLPQCGYIPPSSYAGDLIPYRSGLGDGF